MVILERPYVSEMFIDYLRENHVPVLANAFSAGRGLNLLDSRAARLACERGERVYTSSENALAWIYQHLASSQLVKNINIMKDKAAMRRALREIYPDYFFQQIASSQLRDLDVSALDMPFILKPAIGFFSLGVYTIASQRDWRLALAEIEQSSHQFPASVLDQASFLLEEYISGDEFAVDMYYDEQGLPVILNIMQHRFASASDVSDRLYITGKHIIDQWLPRFTEFFSQVNGFLNIRDFPAHVELRVRDGVILPIEFNPMRFAGLCTTDIAAYAYGINTVDCYLRNLKPDFSKAKAGVFSMVIMDKPPDMPSNAFDFTRLRRSFSHVLEMRELDLPELPAWAMVFAQTINEHELDAILHATHHDYLKT